MLVLTRRIGERVQIDGGITVVVRRISGKQVSLGIEAPKSINIWRPEAKKNK